MKRNISGILIVIISLMLCICNSSEALVFDQSKMTLKIIDEQQNPIEKANVKIGFEVSGRKGPEYNMFEGLTSAEGVFSASAACNSHVGFTITKAGYYESNGKYDFSTKGSLRWEPWNPEITVVLRKIENPVPMYARDTKQSPVKIPISGKDVGFDLILFDWLAPYGRGQVADFYCNLQVRESSGNLDFGYNLNITFPREFDGIQSYYEDLMAGSEFKLLRFAPERGYNKSLNIFIDRKPVGASSRSYQDNRNYFFRVRSEVEDGKLKRAIYGKIVGDIKFGKKVGSTVFLNFKYYLNPDYTRNLEFDPKRNLFLNLPEYEQVHIK